MSPAITTVALLWLQGRVERWVRFGRPVDETLLDRRRRVLAFAPGSILAFVRWAANDHGTIASRIDILRAVQPGEPCTTIPYVQPGGDILLRMSCWPKVQLALEAIDAVEGLGIDAADACPDHWRHVHNRLSAGHQPRPYTRERHRAWLRREAVGL